MKPGVVSTVTHLRTLLVGVHSPNNPIKNIQSYYDEFINLVTSNGIEYEDIFLVKIRTIDSAYFLTKGKVEDLAQLVTENKIDEVIFSEPLNAQQERNLSDLLGCRVFDRTQLILELFEKGAQSAEGKTQVELALLQHRKSRLAGLGIHMSQQEGRTGGRGPGETQKERDIQHIEKQITRIKKELAQLEKVRHTQRKRRLETGTLNFCLIGYTNSGKSTILNILTKSNVLAEDRLFATLDTTTRSLVIEGKKKGVLSDTVGFIQQLPHHLVEAFKSTLTELQYAHLLLHVVDISDLNWQNHISVVMHVLKEMDVDKPILYVFNKIDLVANENLIEREIHKYHPHVLVSALSKDGIRPLIEFLEEWEPNDTNDDKN